MKRLLLAALVVSIAACGPSLPSAPSMPSMSGGGQSTESQSSRNDPVLEAPPTPVVSLDAADGSEVSHTFESKSGSIGFRLPLRVSGGNPPFVWFVDGTGVLTGFNGDNQRFSMPFSVHPGTSQVFLVKARNNENVKNNTSLVFTVTINAESYPPARPLRAYVVKVTPGGCQIVPAYK